MILWTVPGMVVVGCSGIRAVSRFSSAILADLAMRGFAISFLTLAVVELSGFFLAFLCDMPDHDTQMKTMQSHFAQVRKYTLFFRAIACRQAFAVRTKTKSLKSLSTSAWENPARGR
jgi:hypothetical protein